MKFLALIQIISMLSLGSLDLLSSSSRHQEEIDLCCCCDLNGGCTHDTDSGDKKSTSDCSPGCDCGCSLITALGVNRIALPLNTFCSYPFQSFDFNYAFEYRYPLLQPPRIA